MTSEKAHVDLTTVLFGSSACHFCAAASACTATQAAAWVRSMLQSAQIISFVWYTAARAYEEAQSPKKPNVRAAIRAEAASAHPDTVSTCSTQHPLRCFAALSTVHHTAPDLSGATATDSTKLRHLFACRGAPMDGTASASAVKPEDIKPWHHKPITGELSLYWLQRKALCTAACFPMTASGCTVWVTFATSCLHWAYRLALDEVGYTGGQDNLSGTISIKC
jgi:hypothetical protein